MRKNKKRGGETGSNQKPTCTEAVQVKPLQIIVYNNFDRAFKAFRALVQKERILSSYKERQYFEKPSAKRRKKRNDANRSRLEQERKES